MTVANPYRVGDDVVFVPDENTIQRYQRAFARLRIWPGYTGPVIRITGDLVRVGDSLKAFPWTQFQPASNHMPASIEKVRAAYERRYYAGRGANPFALGQRVRFLPSALCEMWHGDRFRAGGLYPGCVGTVTAIHCADYVEIDNTGLRYHWSEFHSVGDGSRDAGL